MSIRDDIKAYLDGELDESRRAEVEAALKQDPELREEAESLARIGGSIRHYVRQPSVQGAGKALDAARSRHRRLPRWLPWSAAAAACLLFLGVAGPQALGGRAFLRDASVASPAAEMAVGHSGEMAMQPESLAPSEDQAVRSRDAGADSSVPLGLGVLADRQMIQTAELHLMVRNVQTAMTSAAHIATTSGGGFVESRQFRHAETTPTAHMVIRVPQDLFDVTVGLLRQLGEVESESTATQDVTVQVADVEARLRALRAEEDQYIAMLRGAKTIGEVLSVREQMNQARREIESLEAQRKALQQLTSLSTISLTLEGRPTTRDMNRTTRWADDALNQAVLALGAMFRMLGTVAIYVLVLTPIWLPGVLLGWWFWRRLR